MKVMKNKWCWIGLVLCTSSLAWGAKDKKSEKSDADAKETTSEKSEKADKADADSGDETSKDETADDEEVTPKATPKKEAASEKVGAASSKHSTVLNMGLLGSLGASTYTRFGFGLRGGLTLGPKEGLYIGGTATYFAGTSVTQRRLSSPPDAEKTRSTFVFGVDVGYDAEASTDFIVRPYLSPGVAYISDKTCATGDCTNDNGLKVTLAPGLQGIYSLAPLYFGADLRYQIIMNTSDASAAILSITVGLRI